MRHLRNPRRVQHIIFNILTPHMLERPFSAPELLAQSYNFIDGSLHAAHPANGRPLALVGQRLLQHIRDVGNRRQNDGLIASIQDHSTPVLEVDEERPRDEPRAQRVRMRKVIHEDAGLEKAVLELLLIAVQVCKVPCDEVLVYVRRASVVVLDAPFRGAEAPHAGCDACVN